MSSTKSQNLPFATDEECGQLRQRLVRAGKIIPAERSVSADRSARRIPVHGSEPPAPPRRRRNVADIPEEGVYRVRRIASDEEYERRKGSYLTMLQSILRSRIELGLEFGEREDEMPEGPEDTSG